MSPKLEVSTAFLLRVSRIGTEETDVQTDGLQHFIAPIPVYTLAAMRRSLLAAHAWRYVKTAACSVFWRNLITEIEQIWKYLVRKNCCITTIPPSKVHRMHRRRPRVICSMLGELLKRPPPHQKLLRPLAEKFSDNHPFLAILQCCRYAIDWKVALRLLRYSQKTFSKTDRRKYRQNMLQRSWSMYRMDR